MSNTKKQRFVGEEGVEAPHGSTLAHVIASKRRRVDTSKLKKRERKRRERGTRAKRALEPGSVDWGVVEHGKRPDKPDVTFAPAPKRLARWTEILERKPNDPDRQALEQRLGDVFQVIYTRYRQAVQPGFTRVLTEDIKYCRAAARLCILKHVRPYQVIKYWHANISNFTSMKFPPLPFLASSGNIDRVSVDVDIQGSSARSAKHEDPRIHAYSDTSGLHPRLRRGLMNAGFDLSQFSDRHLLTVQATAAAVKRGHADMFISSKLRPMVEWAVAHLEGLE